MRRLRAEAHTQQVVAPGSHQGVDYRREFLGPASAGGENDGSRAGNRPFLLFGAQMAVSLRQPAMPENVQPKAGSAVQIGLKGQSLLLPVPRADEPFEGNRPRFQADGYSRIVEPVRREAEAGLQKSHTQPPRIQDFSLVATRRFHPAQRIRSPAPVIAGEVEKPCHQEKNRTERVDEHQASHKASNCEYYD